MSAKDLLGFASPLSDQQVNQLQQGIADLSAQQLAWVSGYFWALSQTGTQAAQLIPAAASAGPQAHLTVIYASQTGNAKGVAQQVVEQAQALGLPASLYSADDYKGKQLGKETHVLIVASTNGEGEPPDNAITLHEFLQSKKAPKLDALKYAVIGLGDSSYEFFCQTGKDFDNYLGKLGASAFAARLDCDVDYQSEVDAWIGAQLGALKAEFDSVAPAAGTNVNAPVATTTAASAYNKRNPYPAPLLTSQRITGRDSDKAVHHIELDLEDSGLHYQPGDALGVYFDNDAGLVDAILAAVDLDGQTSVTVDEQALTLREALISQYEITSATPQLIGKYAELSGSKKLEKLAQDKDACRQYANNTQIIDVLKQKKTKLSAEQLLGLLRRLTPRLYSIASSQAEVGEEVHLTVGVVRYQVGDETREGGASSYLANRVQEGDTVRVYVESNDHFKLPSADTDVVMIGPGTGIAPFRAFIQERDDQDGDGRNWLFFGDRTFTQDFLYQVEWQKYIKDGVLDRIDLAFSRDQSDKVYVQHRIAEQGAELWQWLENGAHLYICGDATLMAKDVHEALKQVVIAHGNKDETSAEAYLNELRQQKRYQKDVY
ncbi:Sulfite reductase [NADPH] flavoprotein alpha-component [Vibrio stylophorae]|uniref:Sulfite reductase [NADPH] flavoprotein alpha-component n=1 Tax=Vibrio stylophorae TaxID=659351 RepID=A0ABM8ZQS3_9VIBR|nr:assimilatory sulfite reductase (NADPH) flavoprotein subunit [Vibrio stylophorae]CAH0532428.1 Sulfite reductase [NADPH] flavoprotein alpha-component [Vibrio stylophorae]